MLYGNYRFNCRLKNEAVLPEYKGSTIRGVFGTALKKVVCALKQKECESCILNQECIYSVVFENRTIEAPVKTLKSPTIPHPFVIEPPETSQSYFASGSSIDFNLLLFGEVNHSIPYFIYAIDQAGKTGIGKKINNSRSQFILEEVSEGGRIIYSDTDQKITKQKINQLTLSNHKVKQDDTFRLRIEVKTPFRFKFEKRYKADLPFHVLTRAMLRRVSSLLYYYDGGEPLLDYKGMVKRAEAVKIVENNLEWFDWRRYSFRQKTGMLMGGIVGSIIYEGKMGEYLPLFEFCENVHLGKQTTFGLGKIKTKMV